MNKKQKKQQERAKKRRLEKLKAKIRYPSNLNEWSERKIEQSRKRRHKESIKIKVGFEYKKEKR